jgi:hypothetical protein
MRAIDRDRWPAPVRDLIRTAFDQGRPRTLPFDAPVGAARAALEALPDDLGGGRVHDRVAVVGLRAALWLLHDFMDQAHELLQQIEETPPGQYWHAILHRREPDAANARYWFGRLGEHAIFPELLADTREIGAGASPSTALARLVDTKSWDASAFVGLATGRIEGALEGALLAIQRREWELLFDREWTRAFTT